MRGFGLLERILLGRREAEVRQSERSGRSAPKGADGPAERGPLGAGALQQDHFVFCEEDEIAVRICSETAFGCRLAESSERFQSSPVIVLKSGSPGRVREGWAADAGGLSGEGVLHCVRHARNVGSAGN